MVAEKFQYATTRQELTPREAGVSPIVIARFLSGERDIRLATADKLAEALGLTLPVK